MSVASAPPAKPSKIERLLKHVRSRSRTSPPNPASPSTQASTLSAVQSPGSSSAQTLTPFSSASAAPSSSHRATSNAPSSSNLLDDALNRLSDSDRETLREYLPTPNDADLALRQALTAAKEKQRCYMDQKWTFTFAGKKITLKEEADKVVHWLNRFKGVGNIAANADPIHVGLPWAGIRFLLEAAVSEANQMASLLVGCKTVLYMANRLKVYMDFLHGLPATLTLARTNLEMAVTELYAHILQFLARAIQIYTSPTIKRVIRAFWKESDVQEFEQLCDKIALRVDIEARNCDRTLSAQDRECAEKLKQDLQRALEELNKSHTIQESLSHLETKLGLDKLPYARGAMFNSHEVGHVTCHPATRVDLLGKIQDWAQQPRSKSIFWLSGMAGTGKSTIARTFAEWLTSQSHLGVVDLGASFFFKRGEGGRGSASQFFSTITHQLVLKIPGLDGPVANAITSDPLIFDKNLAEQFNKLIYQPLCEVKIPSSGCPIVVLVVDALDECNNTGHIETILALLSELPQITSICLKVFLTSRPDLPIQQGFRNISIDVRLDIVLDQAVSPETIRDDINTFVKDEFSKVREGYNARQASGDQQLGPDWPSDNDLKAIVNMAVPLFIVAATICRFVGDFRFFPEDQLETILQPQSVAHLSGMEQTYLSVLRQMSATLCGSDDEGSLYQKFRTIVGPIVTLAEPLSVMSLSALLGLRTPTINSHLDNLRSVLQVPGDLETPVQTLHLSFPEFLLSDKFRHEPFGIDGPATHRMLSTRCLQLLSSKNGLHDNMCELRYPGQLRKEVGLAIIDRRFPSAFRYACRYWVHHVQHSMVQIRDEDEVHRFLQKHFLHWLEALSLMNRISEVIEQLDILESLVSVNESGQIVAFLEDARRIVLSNRYIVDLAPLQIYSSAMIFAPQTSVVRKVCGRIPEWLRRCPITPAEWSLELQKLEGHTDWVTAVAFSRDGSLLASASGDQTVRLWNPRTGQELQKLEGHTGWVAAVAFSRDGSLLASASGDRTVRLWNPRTGQELQKLEGHTGSAAAVAFSRDGSLLASASGDETVRLWNPRTGQELQKLEGHTGWVTAVAFSRDGSLLASASGDETVRLWNPRTGQELQKLEGHTDWVTAVAFSRDGSLLASASGDGTVRLWNPRTSQELHKLEGQLRIATLSFQFGDTALLTNRGMISIGEEFIPCSDFGSSARQSTILKHDWIRQGNYNVLWLPHEYRDGPSAFYDSTIAIGLNSGQVRFIQLDSLEISQC